MGLDNINPMANLYKDYIKILKSITIKYSYLAEKNETFETKKAADGYIEAMEGNDHIFTYDDYTENELLKVEIYDYKTRQEILRGNIHAVPKDKRDALLKLRRQRTIDNYVERNEYYRMLNGLPPLDTKAKDIHYITSEIATAYNIDKSIPIHAMQDYYNQQKDGEGDRIINLIDGLGIISRLKENFPEEKYLNYIGSNRIDLIKARRAKNFEILSLDKANIRATVYDAFIEMYGKCREYFATTIFNPNFRGFFDYYDNFLAMCIMVMTMQQLIMEQIPFEVRRNFFDVYGVQMLYTAYNIPYDLDIDEETQNNIMRNLNLIIQHKATDKVIYDIGTILGFSNLQVYKFYLAKEHKYDIYGVPIFKYKEQFNTDTGEMETVPDYEAMYDIYFQKEELRNNDFIQTFNSMINREDYEEITTGDPFWWEDQNLFHRKWDVDYNFIETKYLSLGLSYSMTDIIFENILLLNLLIDQQSKLSDVKLSVPKILDGVDVPIFDLVILLICLIAKKHHLTGEIISIPTQVIDVLDYLQNVNGGEEYTVDTFGFDFGYLLSPDGVDATNEIKEMLGEEDAKLFAQYISILSIDSNATVEEKIETLNKMYDNIKNLYEFLQKKMTSCGDKELYYALKHLYQAVFYTREMKSLFTITGKTTGFQRTAKNYFEFLYYLNPKLYSAIFRFDEDKAYNQYLESISPNFISKADFFAAVERGEIDCKYDNLQVDEMSGNAKISEDTLYYYINHIISRFKSIIDDINFLYLANDSATPLQELLVKLVEFAKSFTVDMLDLDIIYVFDTKLENLIRLLDAVHYINKLIGVDDIFNVSHSDIVHKIEAYMDIQSVLRLKDICTYAKDLIIESSEENHLLKKDLLYYMNKLISACDTSFTLFDSAKVEGTLFLNDQSHPLVRDGIYKLWYSD